MCVLFAVEMNIGHVIIVPHKSMETSLCHQLTKNKIVKREPFHQIKDFEHDNWTFTFTELALNHVCCNLV